MSTRTADAVRPPRSSSEALSLLVIIPAYNEEATLGGVIARIRQEAPHAAVAVVIDLPTDRTEEVARAAGATVLKLPIRMGIGGAVRAGFRFAWERGYRAALQFDADGQHDAADIARLVEPLAAGEADLVIGSRFITGEGYQSAPARRAAIRFFSRLTSALAGTPLTDITSGLRAVGPRLLPLYARAYPVEYPDAEAILQAVYCGFRVREVPVRMHARQAGHSSVTWSQSVYYPFKVLVSIAAAAMSRRHYAQLRRTLPQRRTRGTAS